MGTITLKFGDRKVEWELDEESIAMIAQNLISAFGPAKDVK